MQVTVDILLEPISPTLHNSEFNQIIYESKTLMEPCISLNESSMGEGTERRISINPRFLFPSLIRRNMI